ncbi:molybdopterin-containing oxidoreductase family protein [Xiamenia xianingshaonis]|uniref:molybdopterin-containing oxidoreductase family protein n=1 Tax=Xiamenia xianingshaonis TaxID=2682776 RepID=UPI0014091C95|nr:molybdopterin-dependent oxidoreductase [Xiamenia xianingshaonis]
MSKRNSPQGGLTRRSFLKTTGAVAGMAAVAGLTGCAQAADPVQLAAAGEGGEERVCIAGDQYSGCASCQTEVIVREGKVVGNRRWMDDPRGNRPCLKGLSKFQRLYTDDRIKYPMKRTGVRGEGKWERISWDDALEVIVDKWDECLQAAGPQSFLIVGGGGKGGGYIHNYVVSRLGNVLGCSVSGPCNDFALAQGHNKVFGPSTNTWGFPYLEFPTALKDSKTCIAWSSNRTISAPQDWRGIAAAQEQGMKLVSVDCTYTVLSQKADLWVRPKPGTDTVLIFGIMQHMIANNMTDEDFLRDHTVAPVLIDQDTLRYARLSLIDSNYPQESVEYPYGPDIPIPISIDPILVWDSAAGAPGILGEVADPPLHGEFKVAGKKVRTAYDMLIDTVNEWPVEKAAELTKVPAETIMELADICYDGPVYHHCGYGAQSYNNGVQLGHAMATLGALTGNTCRPGAAINSGWIAPAFNTMYMAPTGFNSIAIPQLEIPNVLETGKFMGQDWPIKMVLLQGSSMIGGGPDTARNVKALVDNVELIIGADMVFNDAVKYADIVLPVANFYEQEEVMFSGSWVLYMEKCTDPLYEAKTDGEIARWLGCGLGHEDLFGLSDEECAREALDSDAMRELGITYDTVKEKHAVRWLQPDYCHDLNFETDTGRMEFYVDDPQPRIDYGQAYNYDKEHLPYWFPPTEAWETTEEMKKYPLVYTSERARNRYHTQDAESVWLLELEPEPIVRLNPRDAAEREVLEGDYVDVFNNRGTVIARATLSEAVRPGMVVYPKGWQMHQFAKGSGCWGDLHNGEFDPVGVNSSYYDNVCDVRKHEGTVEFEGRAN